MTDITWFRDGSETEWVTPTSHRGHTANIVYADGVGYTLTITGPDAPLDATYDTLRNAKNGFRKWLHNVAVS